MTQRSFLPSLHWFRLFGVISILIAFGQTSQISGQGDISFLRIDKINAEKNNNRYQTALLNEKIGIYFYINEINVDSGIFYFKLGARQFEEIDSLLGAANCYQNVCFAFYELKKEPDSALFYCDKAVILWNALDKRLKKANLQKYMGVLLAVQGKIAEAKIIINKAIDIFTQENYPEGVAVCYFDLAIAYKENQDLDSCYHFTTKAREFWLAKGDMNRVSGLNNFLLETFMEHKKYRKMVKKLLQTSVIKTK